MCWCAPTTQRWSLTSTTKEVCGRARCTGWRTRSLCGPRVNSSRWEQFTSWASQCGSRHPVEAGAEARGMDASRRGGEADLVFECLARLRWTSLRLGRHRKVPSGTLWLIRLHWGWMPWYRLGRGFGCMPFPRLLCSPEFWRECAGAGFGCC